jgi:hypothetical protein
MTTTIASATTTGPTTAPAVGAAPKRRVGRTLTMLGSVSLLFAVGCGADEAGQEDAPAALSREATRSATGVEQPTFDVAEQTLQRHIENARGSDRHLEQLAEAIPKQTLQQRIENARGSDRHLEMLAAELAATSDPR